ncbi:hypothetical protein GH714_005141 [Hevea brasiliensis]|uniref:Uncharacterized protein n=1 Tax=Hevea brasiliensis TaxID=3981 RepID=A0A6A6NBW7_HEVBR|nr:hypothetical protein GH714_005141 [Hevea brasiliensis]
MPEEEVTGGRRVFLDGVHILKQMDGNNMTSSLVGQDLRDRKVEQSTVWGFLGVYETSNDTMQVEPLVITLKEGRHIIVRVVESQNEMNMRNEVEDMWFAIDGIARTISSQREAVGLFSLCSQP